MAKCKVEADPDQTEVYNDLPDEYFRDECFRFKKGITAVL